MGSKRKSLIAIAHLLVVYEINAATPSDAMDRLEKVLGQFKTLGPAVNRAEVRDSILFRQLSEVRSDAAIHD